jgi:hypothetical protein
MAEGEPSRPGLPWWAFALAVGGAIVVVWWILSLVMHTVGLLVRGLLWALLIGGFIYLVLTVMGRQPGRRT